MSKKTAVLMFFSISAIVVLALWLVVTTYNKVVNYFQPKQEVIVASSENCGTYGKKMAVLSLYANKADLARDYKALCEVLPKLELSYEQATQGCNLTEDEVSNDVTVWVATQALREVKPGLENYRVLCDSI